MGFEETTQRLCACGLAQGGHTYTTADSAENLTREFDMFPERSKEITGAGDEA